MRCSILADVVGFSKLFLKEPVELMGAGPAVFRKMGLNHSVLGPDGNWTLDQGHRKSFRHQMLCELLLKSDENSLCTKTHTKQFVLTLYFFTFQRHHVTSHTPSFHHVLASRHVCSYSTSVHAFSLKFNFPLLDEVQWTNRNIAKLVLL